MLDSLNDIVCVDHKQIASMPCSKIYDFEGTCSCAIGAFIERVHDNDNDHDDNGIWHQDKKHFST